MDKLSVSSLIPSASIDKNKVLGISSLCNPRENREKNDLDLNINKLINLREERRKRVFKQYDKVFKMCMTRIHTANQLNNTETIYTIPEAAFSYPEYNQEECILHVQKKLRDNNFDTFVLTQKDIYISWLNLEKNIKDREREREKKEKEREKERERRW